MLKFILLPLAGAVALFLALGISEWFKAKVLFVLAAIQPVFAKIKGLFHRA